MRGLSRITLETIVKAIPAGVVVIEKEHGKVCYVNDRAIQLYGVDPRELENDNSTKRAKLFTSNGEDYPIQKLPAILALVNGKEAKDSLIIERQDGSRITVSGSATPLRDEEGQIVGSIGIFDDVTERKQLEKQIQEYTGSLEKLVQERTKEIHQSEQKYRELYESFDEAFMATDWELNVIHWNQAAERVTKVKAADALGKKIYDILPEMASVDVTPYFEALQQRKPTRFMMNTVSRETGHSAIFEISTYPSELGIIVIVEDKTEEERTKRLSAIGQTAGMVGHDIRNPLQSIISELYLAKTQIEELSENSQKKNLKESIACIEEQTFYINKIVTDLQDIARTTAPQMTEIDVEKTIREVLGSTPFPPNIASICNIQKNCPKLILDSSYLRRILTNLISNAVQAMPNGGKITVSVVSQNNNALISVEDTGEGMSDEANAKVFTPLFTTKAKGQGFGLAVVKKLTEAMGGTVSFESDKGKGVKFTLQFPISKKYSN